MNNYSDYSTYVNESIFDKQVETVHIDKQFNNRFIDITQNGKNTVDL